MSMKWGAAALVVAITGAAVGFNAYDSLDSSSPLADRAFSLVGVCLVLFMGGYLLGRAQAHAFVRHVLAHVPDAIAIHTDQDGHRHAFLHSDDNLSVMEIPDEITNPDDALSYVIEHLLDEGDE